MCKTLLARALVALALLGAAAAPVAAAAQAPTPLPPVDPAPDESAAVIAAVRRYFAAYPGLDLATIEGSLLPSGTFYAAVVGKDGQVRLREMSIRAWIENVRTRKPKMKELMAGEEARVHGPIAAFNSRYWFFLDGKVTNCGTQLIQLVRKEAEWKIANMVWSNEPDCGPPPAVQSGAG